MTNKYKIKQIIRIENNYVIKIDRGILLICKCYKCVIDILIIENSIHFGYFALYNI